jgi:hypothetical protein
VSGHVQGTDDGRKFRAKATDGAAVPGYQMVVYDSGGRPAAKKKGRNRKMSIQRMPRGRLETDAGLFRDRLIESCVAGIPWHIDHAVRVWKIEQKFSLTTVVDANDSVSWIGMRTEWPPQNTVIARVFSAVASDVVTFDTTGYDASAIQADAAAVIFDCAHITVKFSNLSWVGESRAGVYPADNSTTSLALTSAAALHAIPDTPSVAHEDQFEDFGPGDAFHVCLRGDDSGDSAVWREDVDAENADYFPNKQGFVCTVRGLNSAFDGAAYAAGAYGGTMTVRSYVYARVTPIVSTGNTTEIGNQAMNYNDKLPINQRSLMKEANSELVAGMSSPSLVQAVSNMGGELVERVRPAADEFVRASLNRLADTAGTYAVGQIGRLSRALGL